MLLTRPLYQRILQVANHHTGYGIESNGQESFTIIQYNIADQYMPHCDSDCDGSEYIPGGRIATAVLYCKGMHHTHLFTHPSTYLTLIGSYTYTHSLCLNVYIHCTYILHYTVAEEGGATTFTKSDLFVKPSNGSATFFAYRGPDNKMDPESLTEHSGCPVTQGEKWIG